MHKLNVSAIVMAAGLFAAAPSFAQTSSAQKQHTQDGGSPTMVGPGSKAYKQRTDGEGPAVVGPGSGAYKQGAQSLSHADETPVGAAKQK